MKISTPDRPYLWLLVCSTTLLVLHQIMQRVLEISAPFIDSYLDPFLSIPFLLSGFVLERRLLLNITDYRLSIVEVVVLTLALSLIFEYIFPLLSPEFIFDVWDFAAYALGGVLFYLVSLLKKGVTNH